jgi:hypothetical protein
VLIAGQYTYSLLQILQIDPPIFPESISAGVYIEIFERNIGIPQ